MSLINDFAPTLKGAAGVTMLGVVPDPTNSANLLQLVVVVITALTQIIGLFKKKKKDETQN